jgi:hypothetical protein
MRREEMCAAHQWRAERDRGRSWAQETDDDDDDDDVDDDDDGGGEKMVQNARV